MSFEFLSYGKQNITDQDIEEIIKVLKSDYLTQGPKIEEFEHSLCEYTGARYCVAVANGTAALHIAVQALNISSGMHGMTSPISFLASSNCLIYNNLKPVFADIKPDTYNVSLDEIKKQTSERLKLIIPVHFAGQPADMQRIREYANFKKIFVIEDAAHAIGSKYADGSRVGNCNYSDMTIFSFHPVKTITTGEGGAITTNSKELFLKLKLLRSHGITREKSDIGNDPDPWYYEMRELGYNYRLTDIQAALGISQLKQLNDFITRRRKIVQMYNDAFKDIAVLTLPFQVKDVYSAFHLYILQIDFELIGKTRKQIMNELKQRNIGTQVHYIPIHTQPFYQKKFGYKWGDFPVAEEYYSRALSIPLYPKMTDFDVHYVIKNIKEILS